MSSEYWKMPGFTIRILYYRPLCGWIDPGNEIRNLIIDNYIEFERVKNWISGFQKIGENLVVAGTILCDGWKCLSCGREFVDYEGMTELHEHATKHAYGIEDR